MKVVLVNPPRFRNMPVGREDRCENTIPNILPPTGLVYLSTFLLEEGHDLTLVDANGYNLNIGDVKKIIEKNKPDFVVFKATPESFYEDIKVASCAKELNSGIKTIMISWTLSTVPEEVLLQTGNVDYYIIDFYYERPIIEILKGKNPEDVKGIAYKEINEVKVNASETKPFDFNSINLPEWDLIPSFDTYWVQVPSISPWTFVMSAKGCGMNCSFCTITDVKPRFRDPKAVIDEIEYLNKERNLKYISFFDATFNISRKRLFDMCEELINRDLNDLKWFANVRADISKDEAIIMRESGCRGVSIGIESGSQKVLDLAHKKITVNQAENAIKNLKEVGIKQYASFIVGLPGETLGTLNETKKFILKTKPTGFQVNSLVPYPRSQIYKEAVQEGRINELRFDDLMLYDSPLSLCDVSIEEINDFRKNMYNEIYKNPGWWISNIKYVIKNPKDMSIGVDYALKVLKRLFRGVDNEV